MHPNSDWFLVWLETEYPGEMVVTDGTGTRPLVTWTTMGGPLHVHLITAHSITELLGKQRQLLGATLTPPLWTLGYNLCRNSGDSRRFRTDISGMTKAKIQFDSDCVDEQLIISAFEINPKFSTLATDVAQLTSNGKQFLLPLVIQRSYNNDVGQKEGCLVDLEINEAGAQCISGKINEGNVMYPDMATTDWIAGNYKTLQDELINTFKITPTGWKVHGSHPVDEETEKSCNSFAYHPRDTDMSTGLLCQHAWSHYSGSELVSHHASYSKQVSQAFNEIPESKYQFSEVYSYSGHVGGYQGSRVNSTWAGLSQSLREVMFLGLAGQSQVAMPVCGTHTDNSDPDLDLGQLCLRWSQLAAFMPSLRSWYAEDDNRRMPYSLAKQYQEYITWALETRYSLILYMRTLQLDWVTSGVPMVRPMFVHYPHMWDTWTQLMLGSDLVISAVTQADQQLVNVSLPAGTWYEYYSGVKYFSPTAALQLAVPTQLYQLPVFIRGGSVIVLYYVKYDSQVDTPQTMQVM